MSRTESGFHNPYNFVPLCDRISDGPLSQGKPPGHHVYGAGLFEGRIEVELTAASPLLLLDPSKAQVDNNDHRTVDILTDAQGKPILRPTSLKGALRSAYEAITCSRLGVFHGHDRPLARRMAAGDGLTMVPARVSDTGDKLELYLGRHKKIDLPTWDTTHNRWKVPNGEMYAAWLPLYWSRGSNRCGPVIDRNAIKYPSGRVPKHGDRVDCWLCLVERVSRPNRNGNRRVRFKYWRVVYIQPAGSGAMPPKTHISASVPTLVRRDHRNTGQYLQITDGYVCVTNQNIGRKHDERVFFVSSGSNPTKTIPLTTKPWLTDWKYLTEDYQREHEGDLKRRKKSGAKEDAYLGDRPGQTAWSRHVIDKRTTDLKPRDLCYARVDSTGKIVGLYPVMISRELAMQSPRELLRPDTLLPADQLGKLSPADRVFGWVRQGKDDNQGADPKSAYKGHVRVRRVRCRTSAKDAVHRFTDTSLPIAILSTPKPQQARFYAAGAQNYDKGVAKSLSGRKFYLHHRSLPHDYWSPAGAISDAEHRGNSHTLNNRFFREYIRLRSSDTRQRDNQNQSLRAWVKKETKFSAEIRFDNLNEAELGALLWLCNLGVGRHLKVGAGKPLGFGSVTTKIADVQIRSPQAMRAEYAALVPTSKAVPVAGVFTCAKSACDNFVPKFKEALCGTDGALETHPAVAAFLAMAEGPAGGPVHYPRESRDPDARGENYRWFVWNQREPKRPLPTPGKGDLPYRYE